MLSLLIDTNPGRKPDWGKNGQARTQMTHKLSDTARLRDHEPQPELSSKGPFLVFEVSGLSCGLPAGEIREVLPMCEVVRPPALPPVLEGFLNLRGQLTPVVRLDRLFGLAEVQFLLHTHLVVLQRRPPLALLVDRVREIMSSAPGGCLEPPPEHVFGDCLEEVYQLDTRSISLLRVDRLLLKEEESRISEFVRIAERRLEEIEKATP